MWLLQIDWFPRPSGYHFVSQLEKVTVKLIAVIFYCADPMTVSNSQDPWLGQVLGGRYRLESLLGISTTGRVYRATNLTSSTEVGTEAGALSNSSDSATTEPDSVVAKIMVSSLVGDPELRERFRREVEICSVVRDPHILRILDYGVVPLDPDHLDPENSAREGLPYLIREYVRGVQLTVLLEENSPFAVADVCNLSQHIMAGLRAVHAGIMQQGRLLQVVHRNLSPSNIFVRMHEGDWESARLTGFEFAGYVGEIVPESGLVWGNVPYASPEQLRGGEAIDARSDIYSLGCILYQMLAGHNCFKLPDDATTIDWVNAHLAQPPIAFNPNLRIPEAIAAVVYTCLNKDPNHRYTSVVELSEALEQAQAGAQSSPMSNPTLQRYQSIPMGSILILGLSLVAVVVGGYWLATRQPDPSEDPQSSSISQYDEAANT